MEILNIIGINESQLRKVSPETASSLVELESLSEFVESKDAPFSLKEEYSRIESEIERFIVSDDFKSMAKKVGVKLKAQDDIAEGEEIIIEAAPQVKKTIREIAQEKRERAKQKSKDVEVIKPIESEKVVEELPVTPIKEGIENYGMVFKSKSSSSTQRATYEITALCSYGGNDYTLHISEVVSNKIAYKLALPKSEANLFFVFNNTAENTNLRDLNEILGVYFSSRTAELVLIGINENEINSLSNILTTTQYQERDIISNEEILQNNIFNDSSYDDIDANDSYSSSFLGLTFESNFTPIKQSWTAEVTYKDGWNFQEDNPQFCVPNIRFSDYLYKSKDSYYQRNGVSIVNNRLTYYAPKGLSKYEQFAEIGSHLNNDASSKIKPSKFTKDVALGKTFQSLSGKTEKAIDSRIIGSSPNKYMLMSEEGDSFLLDKMAFNYFKKYYDMLSLEIKLSDSIAFIFLNGNIIGMIRAEVKTVQGVVAMYDLEAINEELISLNSNVYQFMKNIDLDESEEEVAVIEDTPKEDESEVSESLVNEMRDYFNTITEYYIEAVDEGLGKEILEEFELEIDFYIDSLTEQYEELGMSKQQKELDEIIKKIGL